MQTSDNSLRTFRSKGLLGRHRLTSAQGHGEPCPTYIESGHTAMQALAVRLEEETGTRAVAGGSWGEVLDTPLTAHFIGGAPIGSDRKRGVLDPYHRVWGHPGISVVDGAAVSANLGVNPSLTITAQAERAMSLWPNRGEVDRRPGQDEPYAVLPPVTPHRPSVSSIQRVHVHGSGESLGTAGTTGGAGAGTAGTAGTTNPGGPTGSGASEPVPAGDLH
jgi:cholesterol oxidase